MEAVGDDYTTPLKSKGRQTIKQLTNKMGSVKHQTNEEQAIEQKSAMIGNYLKTISANRRKTLKNTSNTQHEPDSVVDLLEGLQTYLSCTPPGLEKQKSSTGTISKKISHTPRISDEDQFRSDLQNMNSAVSEMSGKLKELTSRSGRRKAMGCSDYLPDDQQKKAIAMSQHRFNEFDRRSKMLSQTSQNIELMNQRRDDECQRVPVDPLKRFTEAAMRESMAFQKDAEQSIEKMKEFDTIKKQHEEKEKQLKQEKEERAAIELKLKEQEEIIKQNQQRFEEEKQRIIADKLELERMINEKDKSKERQILDLEQLKKDLENADATINSVRGALQFSEAQRVAILNQLQEVRGNLRIYCRVRPVKSIEERAVMLSAQSNKEITMTGDLSKRGKPHTYHFDRVFGESTLQDEVFQEVEPFIQSMLDGKRVSIFAYGPTGSGKTHTLEGINLNADCLSDSSGSMPRSLALIVDWIIKHNLFSEPENHLEVSLSCLEIYNERLRDLLSEDKPDQDIQILFNKGKVVLPDIVKRSIATVADALDAIKLSSKRRHTEATAWNSHSSRSHSIYRISIAKKIDGIETGLLNIIDMAGSEKNSSDINAKDSGMSNSKTNAMMAANDRLKKIQKEANFINKSLTTLGRIIRLIKQQRTMGIKEGCIPYRESKLTRLLQDCIGGDAQTLMIVNINPSVKSAGQTKETLNFASTACI